MYQVKTNTSRFLHIEVDRGFKLLETCENSSLSGFWSIHSSRLLTHEQKKILLTRTHCIRFFYKHTNFLKKKAKMHKAIKPTTSKLNTAARRLSLGHPIYSNHKPSIFRPERNSLPNSPPHFSPQFHTRDRPSLVLVYYHHHQRLHFPPA